MDQRRKYLSESRARSVEEGALGGSCTDAGSQHLSDSSEAGKERSDPFLLLFFFFSLPADAFHDYAKPKAFWQGSPAKLLVHRRGQRGAGKEAPVAVRDLTFLPVIRASKAWKWDHSSPGPSEHRNPLWNVVYRDKIVCSQMLIRASLLPGGKRVFQGKEDPSHPILATCWCLMSAPMPSSTSVSSSPAPDESRTRATGEAHV